MISPKQRLQEATKAQMTGIIKRSRAQSARERAYDEGRAAERAWIAGWLRGLARGNHGMPPVDRAECIELVAKWIDTEVWKTAPRQSEGESR